MIGSQNPLYRKAEWFGPSVVRRWKRLEQLQQRRSRVPGHSWRAVNDVVSGKGADRDEGCLNRVSGIGRDLLEHELEVALDGAKRRLAVSNQIHLVYGDKNVPHAEQRRDVGM